MLSDYKSGSASIAQTLKQVQGDINLQMKSAPHRADFLFVFV